MSHLYKTRLEKSSSTEFNENWLDSWEYLEKRLDFFGGFFWGILRSYPAPAVSFKVEETWFKLSEIIEDLHSTKLNEK